MRYFAGVAFLLATSVGFAQQLSFTDSGATSYGIWSAQAVVAPSHWKPGSALTVDSVLSVSNQHLAAVKAAGVIADGFVILATAERTFDASGRLRLPADEWLSTLLTPTGLPIEGGISGAVTNRFGYAFRTPIDLLARVPLAQSAAANHARTVCFHLQAQVPADIPPGIYRVRLDYGFTAAGHCYSLNAESFALRSSRPAESHHYSPPVPVSAADVNGIYVDAGCIQRRIPWVLLYDYNSNGYRGVVAGEDQDYFNLSGRNLIQDEVILPRFDNQQQPLRYSLEPQFPADLIEPRNNIPWNYASGELSAQVTGPDAKTVDFGTLPFKGKGELGPTTGDRRLTQWSPSADGRYTVRASGWIEDRWKNRYSGGGTYRFWIARRMTMSTATFPGMAYPVGKRYGRDISLAPAVPAEVQITVKLLVNSDPKTVRVLTSHGRASSSGLFGPAQGLMPLLLDAPGEYVAHILARYVDKTGQLWVCTMRHAGVVYPPDSPIAAHGKKLLLASKLVDRGETRMEASDYASGNDEYGSMHMSYPYNAGDVLLIASDQQAGNYIDPALTFSRRGTPLADDVRLTDSAASNLRIRTSNALSPHLFPEFITEWAYYYSAAPRPGLMARFLIGEDGVRHPYWSTGRDNLFGGQIHASANGDLPGDIYRLIGGVVIRQPNSAPAYAGYLASAFILPRDTHNNRIIAAGAEDVIGPDGTQARLWLVGTRPGVLYETNTAFLPAVQIDPVLPATITFQLHYPDGRTFIAKGTGDTFGSFVGNQRWVLDIPGIYHYTLDAEWQGHKGRMPGLPPSGGAFYVIEKDLPPAAPRLCLDLPPHSTFDIDTGFEIVGRSTAQRVAYAVVTPGAVIAQGELSVRDGKFCYVFNPEAVNKQFPTYDILNLAAFITDIRAVLHLSFFSKETSAGGVSSHSFVRVIVRGNQIFSTQ